ncbi:hypothetical protein Tco_0967484 [Tanacetum coccineum]
MSLSRCEKKAEGNSRKKSIGRKRAKDKQEQESSKRQRVEDDKEEEELKKCFELAKEEEIAINAIPLATKVPVVGFQIHTRGKPGYYEIFRADGSSKLYHVFSQLLSEFDREDLVNLWKLVKAKHGDNRPEEDFERVLWGDLRVMFEPDVESEVWRSLQGYKVTVWKLYDSCGVHFVRFKHLHVFMLVEKRYPLTPITITNMLNKKLQADQWNEMVYQLLKLMIQKMNIKFRGGLLGLKGFLKLLLLSTAGTKVNAAGLQLLEELLLLVSLVRPAGEPGINKYVLILLALLVILRVLAFCGLTIADQGLTFDDLLLETSGSCALYPFPCSCLSGFDRTDNQEKDEKQSQNDKTGLGMEKLTVCEGKAKAKRKTRKVKVKSINKIISHNRSRNLKNTIGCNLKPSDMAGEPQ